MNHFAKMCKSKAVHKLDTRSKAEKGKEFMFESISSEENVEKPYALIRRVEHDIELANISPLRL